MSRFTKATVYFMLTTLASAGCSSEEQVCARTYAEIGCTETYSYRDGLLVRSDGCGRTRDHLYQDERIVKVTTTPAAFVEDYEYDQDVLVRVELQPSPVASVTVLRDGDGRETGREVRPAPEIDIAYTYASGTPEHLANESWTSMLGTAIASYSYEGDLLTQIDESGFDRYTFWYAYDRNLPTAISARAPNWTVHVDYDENDRETGRRWLTTDVFWSYTNTYGVCED